MSGPVEGFMAVTPDLGVSTIEVREGRSTSIGKMGILRVLPTKGRRTVGPWCFVDLMTPDDVAEPPPLEIGPHPHIGLATVTWLFDGAALHTDSLGTEQLIRPGELNLMSAGHGIAHAELGVETPAALSSSGIMGAQMWLAQTEATRHGASRFEHLPDLPVMELGAGEARVLVETFGDASSPAVVDHPTIGLDLTVRSMIELPVHPQFEYGVVPLDRPVKVEDAIVESGSVALVPPGNDQLTIDAGSSPARLLLLGGQPLGVQIKMWWNFVARTLDEITVAWRAWRTHDESVRPGSVAPGTHRSPDPALAPPDLGGRQAGTASMPSLRRLLDGRRP